MSTTTATMTTKLMKTTTKIEARPTVTGTVLMKFVSAVAAFLILLSPSAWAEEAVIRTHALAEFTTPKYAEGFTHFDYVNPEAIKGGSVVTAEPGSFDSLNSIILRGQVPRSIGLIADLLFVPSGDELEVVYGLIAETAEYPEDKSWVVFNLRHEAKFHDGHPVTAADFVFGWNAIEQHGKPFLKSFLEDVEKVEALDEHRLKVSFKSRGEMKPLIRAASILSPEPEHWWTANDRDISKTTLEPPLTSGAYKIKAVDPGRSITYERVPDYWSKDLPVNVGQNNFDTVRTDFYRDDDVMFEAFKGERTISGRKTGRSAGHPVTTFPRSARVGSKSGRSPTSGRSERKAFGSTCGGPSSAIRRYGWRWRTCMISSGFRRTSCTASTAG